MPLRNHENVLPADLRTVFVPITIGEGLVAAFGYPWASVFFARCAAGTGDYSELLRMLGMSNPVGTVGLA